MTSFGSVCSGIEAASVAWHKLGWTTAWVAEIEKQPSALLAHHYPTVPNLEDMTRIPEYIRYGVIEAPDVLVGGTPCQSFSVAGLRRGMSDPRGQLTISFVNIADAIDEQRKQRNEPECAIVWENVPGVLSDKSNAFGCFIGLLAGEDEELKPPGKKWANAGCVFGPTRTVAWRILDAQYFGVAQRRRRLFVVASARDGFDPTQILFEFEGVRRDTPPSRETGQEIAGTIAACSFVGGAGGKPEGAVANHLQISTARMVAFGEYSDDGTASTLKQRDYKDATDLVVATLDASYARLQGCSGQDANHGHSHLVVAAFAENSRSEVRFENGDGSRAGALSCGGGKPGQGSPTVLCFNAQASSTQRNEPSEHITQTLDRSKVPGVLNRYEVRRLIPVECERLQAFPDKYTDVAGLSDSARYKALGNSMCVNNMHWIGKRIDRHLKSLDKLNFTRV